MFVMSQTLLENEDAQAIIEVISWLRNLNEVEGTSDQIEQLAMVLENAGVEVPDDPNYDPTPYCAICGAMKSKDCKCGPISPLD